MKLGHTGAEGYDILICEPRGRARVAKPCLSGQEGQAYSTGAAGRRRRRVCTMYSLSGQEKKARSKAIFIPLFRRNITRTASTRCGT